MDKQLMALGLTEYGGKVVVSSRDIAQHFEKEHKKTLADICRGIAVDTNSTGSIFSPMNMKKWRK